MATTTTYARHITFPQERPAMDEAVRHHHEPLHPHFYTQEPPAAPPSNLRSARQQLFRQVVALLTLIFTFWILLLKPAAKACMSLNLIFLYWFHAALQILPRPAQLLGASIKSQIGLRLPLLYTIVYWIIKLPTQLLTAIIEFNEETRAPINALPSNGGRHPLELQIITAVTIRLAGEPLIPTSFQDYTANQPSIEQRLVPSSWNDVPTLEDPSSSRNAVPTLEDPSSSWNDVPTLEGPCHLWDDLPALEGPSYSSNDEPALEDPNSSTDPVESPQVSSRGCSETSSIWSDDAHAESFSPIPLSPSYMNRKVPREGLKTYLANLTKEDIAAKKPSRIPRPITHSRSGSKDQPNTAQGSSNPSTAENAFISVRKWAREVQSLSPSSMPTLNNPSNENNDTDYFPSATTSSNDAPVPTNTQAARQQQLPAAAQRKRACTTCETCDRRHKRVRDHGIPGRTNTMDQPPQRASSFTARPTEQTTGSAGQATGSAGPVVRRTLQKWKGKGRA